MVTVSRKWANPNPFLESVKIIIPQCWSQNAPLIGDTVSDLAEGEEKGKKNPQLKKKKRKSLV